MRKDREEETTSFTRTSLGTGHQITATRDNGNGVLLDRCGDLVVSELDVAAQMLIQRRAKELVDRLWHVTSRSLNGNVVILLEVDTSVLLGRVVDGTKELTLDSGVGWARDVLAVPPLSIAGASSRVVAAAATTVAALISSAVAATTTTTAPTTASVVVVLVVVAAGGSALWAVAPVSLAGREVLVLAASHVNTNELRFWMGWLGLPSPGAVAQTVGGSLSSRRWGRTTAVNGGRSIRLAVAHMRGNVRASSGRRASLALRAQVEPTHVELVRHIR